MILSAVHTDTHVTRPGGEAMSICRLFSHLGYDKAFHQGLLL